MCVFELKCQTLLCRHEDFEEELLLNLRVLAMLYGDIAATIDLWVTAAAMGPAQQGNVRFPTVLHVSEKVIACMWGDACWMVC